MLLHLFGYKKSIEDKHKLVINEEQAKVVKKIYEEYSIGKSLTQIVEKLNEKKYQVLIIIKIMAKQGINGEKIH